VPLVVIVVLAPVVVPILWFYHERDNIYRLNEEAHRLGGGAEIPEGAFVLWGFQIQVVADLNGPNVGDDELARLQRMPGFRHVQALDLGGTRITDRSLEVLEGCPRLFTLDLSRTGVTDKGMESLAKLPYLSGIGLSRTEVTDAGLDALIRSRPDLRRVDLTRTKVTAEGLRKLREAFPQIYIRPEEPGGP
jgi:hypothetical protein